MRMVLTFCWTAHSGHASTRDMTDNLEQVWLPDTFMAAAFFGREYH